MPPLSSHNLNADRRDRRAFLRLLVPKKTRGDSPLEKLPVHQRQSLNRWLFGQGLGYREVALRMRSEFGVETSKSALSRYYQREEARRDLQKRKLPLNQAVLDWTAFDLAMAIPASGDIKNLTSKQRKAMFADVVKGMNPVQRRALLRMVKARSDRADSVFDHLPEEQRESLRAWLFTDNLGYREAAARLFKQFGVRSSKSEVARFYQREILRKEVPGKDAPGVWRDRHHDAAVLAAALTFLR